MWDISLRGSVVKRLTFGAMGMVAVAIIAPAAAQMQSSLQVYANFDDARLLDPAKWIAQWQCGGTVMECVREIQDDELRLRVRAYGASNSNQGTQFGSSGLSLASSSVMDIAADLVVRRSETQACSTNPGFSGHAQALIFGSFFNGGGNTPNDDLQAFLQLDRYSFYPTGTVQAGGFLKYQNQFFDNVDLGPVNIGEPVRIELLWDRPNHRFVAKVFHPVSGAFAEQSMSYTVSDTTPAVSPFKSITANVFPANCAGTRVFSDLDVAIKDVLTD